MSSGSLPGFGYILVGHTRRNQKIFGAYPHTHTMRAIVWGGLAFTIFLATTLIGPASSQEEDGSTGCSFTYFDPNCSPSGWISFILGDVLLAMLLALLLHHLQRKSNAKIDYTTRKIEEILHQENLARNRRVIFACQSLKDGFGVVLVSMGIMHMKLNAAKAGDDVSSQILEQGEIIGRSVPNLRDAVGKATEGVDPILVESIYRLLIRLDNLQPELSIGTGFPEYDYIKTTIRNITSSLNSEVTRIKKQE